MIVYNFIAEERGGFALQSLNREGNQQLPFQSTLMLPNESNVEHYADEIENSIPGQREPSTARKSLFSGNFNILKPRHTFYLK
jgi:hypothetical protein